MITMLSIDPGGTTGYCFGTYQDDKLIVEPHQERLSLRAIDTLILGEPRFSEHIIYESFEYRNRSPAGLDLTPVKIIGIIEMHEEMMGAQQHFYKQNAAQGKGFWKDEKIKDMGLWVKGCPHGMDALRHLLYWCAFSAGSQWMNIHIGSTKVYLSHK
jgi:hypothetical protein